MLALYRAVTTLAGPLILAYLAQRRVLGKEDRSRYRERLGCPSRPRAEGPLAWVHAASVGESLSVLPLVGRLLRDHPGLQALMTTGTVTSAALLAGRLPKGAVHQYVPVDRIAYVERFLDHWRPDLALWVESELWPNLVSGTARRGVPMVLVNARMSERAFRGWRRVPGLARRLAGAFALALAQSDADALRLRRLGARDVRVAGNLKFAVPALPVDDAELARLEAALEGRPRWLAASTHAGEEEAAGRAHRDLARRHPRLLTVIVPRHPDRAAEAETALVRLGLAVARRSEGDGPTAETDVYLADTMGELGLFYRLAPVAFVGKSLAARGGQNPIEPAKLGCALVHGPHMENFRDIARRLAAADAAVEVADTDALAGAVGRLLSDPAERRRMGAAAKAVADAEADVLDAVVAALGPFLAALDREAGGAGA